MTVKITATNYDEYKTALKRFLILEIERYSLIAGSHEALSLKLGKSNKYVQMRLDRGAFSGLERLWRECRDLFDKDEIHS